MSKRIQSHWELEVHQLSVEAAMRIFELTKSFPKEEMYSLTDQIRRSSSMFSSQYRFSDENKSFSFRANCRSMAKTKVRSGFFNKLNESEGEAAETQVWLEYAVKCRYLDREIGKELYHTYDNIIGKLVNMGNNPKPWLLKTVLSESE